MKELVEVIAKSLVDNPDEVVVTETESEKTIVIKLKVAALDMGKIIGKIVCPAGNFLQKFWTEQRPTKAAMRF